MNIELTRKKTHARARPMRMEASRAMKSAGHVEPVRCFSTAQCELHRGHVSEPVEGYVLV